MVSGMMLRERLWAPWPPVTDHSAIPDGLRQVWGSGQEKEKYTTRPTVPTVTTVTTSPINILAKTKSRGRYRVRQESLSRRLGRLGRL